MNNNKRVIILLYCCLVFTAFTCGKWIKRIDRLGITIQPRSIIISGDSIKFTVLVHEKNKHDKLAKERIFEFSILEDEGRQTIDLVHQLGRYEFSQQVSKRIKKTDFGRTLDMRVLEYKNGKPKPITPYLEMALVDE